MRVYKVEIQEVYKTNKDIKYFTSYIKSLKYLKELSEAFECPSYTDSKKSNIENNTEWLIETFEIFEIGTNQLTHFGNIACLKIS